MKIKKKVVLYKTLPNDIYQRLADHFTLTSFPEGITPQNIEQVKMALQDAEGMIGASATIDANLLDCAPHLRAISTISVGYDNFDVADLTRRHILLMHTPDAPTESTADTLFTLILSTARRAIEMAEKVKKGDWQGSIGETCFGVDVHHKTIGILGMGRIGAALAKRAHCGFDMSVLYMNRSANPHVEDAYGARRCSLDELLTQSDFICITLPLNAETEHLINAQRLAQMKPGAILINGARGKIIDQAALVDALQRGVIRAAGLDVFEKEPLPVDDPLLSLPNVVALPHIGSATHETRHTMARCAVENLITALEGQVTHSCVNPSVYLKSQP